MVVRRYLKGFVHILRHQVMRQNNRTNHYDVICEHPQPGTAEAAGPDDGGLHLMRILRETTATWAVPLARPLHPRLQVIGHNAILDYYTYITTVFVCIRVSTAHVTNGTKRP